MAGRVARVIEHGGLMDYGEVIEHGIHHDAVQTVYEEPKHQLWDAGHVLFIVRRQYSDSQAA